MNRKILLMLLWCCCAIVYAQNNRIIIQNFKEEATDVTANLADSKVLDSNGEVCALLKIETTQKDFVFDVGMLGVQKTVYQTAEVWVYVPEGVRFLTVSHPLLGKSKRFTFPKKLEAATTYSLQLITGEVQVSVTESNTNQFLVINVIPKNASVEINNEPQVVNDGTVSKYLPFGRYQYNVSAPDYHSDAGYVEVAHGNKTIVNINLKPAFGWADIRDTQGISGADIYIDGNIVGKIPHMTSRLSSGTHQLRITKPLYKVYDTTITISDNDTLIVNPQLVPNFATTTFAVDADAEIWINGEKKSNRVWSGPLEAGTYRVECKQANHRTTTSTHRISANAKGDTIKLDAPTPINGRVTINSTPIGAKIKIDGKEMGETPNLISPILIGEHTLTLEKAGYGTVTKKFTVNENEQTDLEIQLSSSHIVSILSNETGASVYIDNQYIGKTPLHDQTVTIGKHSIIIEKSGSDYKTYKGEVEFTNAKDSYYFNMERNVANISVNTEKFSYLTIDGVEHSSYVSSYNTANLKLENGYHTIKAKYKSWHGEKKIYVNGKDQTVYIGMRKNLVRRNAFYMEGTMTTSSMGGGTLGMYIGNFNIEASYLAGLGEEEMSWLKHGQNGAYHGYYTPTLVGGKIGWGIRLGNKVRLTPQLGLNIVQCSTDGSTDIADGASVTAATISARMSWHFWSVFCLSVTPELSFPVQQTEGYEIMSEHNDNIKAWGNGLNCRFSFGFNF